MNGREPSKDQEVVLGRGMELLSPPSPPSEDMWEFLV